MGAAQEFLSGFLLYQDASVCLVFVVVAEYLQLLNREKLLLGCLH